MSTVKVEHTKCQGHARCATVSPGLFKLDDDGYILPGDIEVPSGEEKAAERGAKACPERALSYVP